MATVTSEETFILGTQYRVSDCVKVIHAGCHTKYILKFTLRDNITIIDCMNGTAFTLPDKTQFYQPNRHPITRDNYITVSRVNDDSSNLLDESAEDRFTKTVRACDDMTRDDYNRFGCIVSIERSTFGLMSGLESTDSIWVKTIPTENPISMFEYRITLRMPTDDEFFRFKKFFPKVEVCFRNE